MVKKPRVPTDKTPGDVAHAVVKAALSTVPVAGGPLGELFAYLITEPVTKRRDAWILEIAGALRELENQIAAPLIERLRNDDSFTTILLNATQSVIRNHQEQKITALRNAVLNAALGKVPDDLERAIMLGLIDRLTPTHMGILWLMQDPTANAAVARLLEHRSMGGLSEVIFTAYPDLTDRKDIIDLIWRDLEDAGLIGRGGMNVTMTGYGLATKRTTAFGDKFLDFIGDPLAGSGAAPEDC